MVFPKLEKQQIRMGVRPKFGDVREDGYIFLNLNKNGGECWVSSDVYKKRQERQKKYAQEKRARNPEEIKERKQKAYRKDITYSRELGRKASWKKRGYPEPTRPEPNNCECCGIHKSELKKQLHLDHCHITNTFRGWLCNNCNRAIGLLNDSREGVLKAIEYLNKSVVIFIGEMI